MTKSEIYRARAIVHDANCAADRDKVPYSPLIRKEWLKYGYIPVSPRHV